MVQTYGPVLSGLVLRLLVVPVLEVLLGRSLLRGAVLSQHGGDTTASLGAAAVHGLVEGGITGVILPLEVRNGRGNCLRLSLTGRRAGIGSRCWKRGSWARGWNGKLGKGRGNGDLFKAGCSPGSPPRLVAYSAAPRLFSFHSWRPISLTPIDH